MTSACPRGPVRRVTLYNAANGRPRRRGFTLVEVLVVLGIMVVLFALLFVPLTSSLQQATTGRRNVERQERLRLAVAQIQGDLREAMYVFPPEVLRDPVSGQFTVNYSTLAFLLPAKDAATGALQQPLRPVRDGSGNVLVTRYAVHTPDTALRLWPSGGGNPGAAKWFRISAGPSAEGGFALYRQQGYCHYEADLSSYVFGSYANVDGTPGDEFVIDRPLAENALTPTTAADMPVSRSFCRDNGAVVDGWVQVNLQDLNLATDDVLDTKPDNTWTPQIVYLFDGVSFAPQRVGDEQLVASADATLYRATRGSWRGLLNDGTQSVADLIWGQSLAINSSELAPRIRVLRWSGAGYNNTVLDTDLLTPAAAPPGPDVNNLLDVRWDSSAGTVAFGQNHISAVDFDVSALPPSGVFWTLTTPADLAAEYPASAPQTRAPVGCVLDPWAAESPPATNRDALVVPDNLRVWLVATDTSNRVRRIEYARTATLDTAQIGIYQFSPVVFDDGRRVELRFNPYQPPSPDLFEGTVNLSSCRLEIQYVSRRNFDPTSGRDDVVLASYSTAEVYSIQIAVSELSPYEPITTGSAIQRPYKEGRPANYTADIHLENMGR